MNANEGVEYPDINEGVVFNAFPRSWPDSLIGKYQVTRPDPFTTVPRLDPSGLLWTFHCVRSLNQDWGDLSGFTDSEDRGGLSLADDSDDWGTLV